MKICIFGAGAIGGYLAVGLGRVPGVEVSAIARGAHLAAIRESGLTLNKDGEEATARIRASDDPAEIGPVDVVFNCLKAHQAWESAEAMSPLLGPETAVVCCQNGVPWWYFHKLPGPFEGRRLDAVDRGDRQWSAIGPERAIGCSVYPAAEITAPGVIRHVYGDKFALGEPDGSAPPRIQRIAEVMEQAGFRAPVLDDIRSELWLKLWGNLCFNPISALTRGTLDVVAGDPTSRATAKAMMLEAQVIAEALGAGFRVDIERRIDGAAKVGKHRTSMLQDLEAGKAMEIDALVTAVVETLVASTQPTNQDLPKVKVARDIQGQRVLSTYVPISRLNWKVFVEQPIGEAFAPMYISILRTGGLLLIGLLASVLASLFLARKMVAPIRVLHARAAGIAAGALDQTIDIRTGDELEELSEEFNRMTARLRESRAGLEQKVKDLGFAYAELEEKSLQLEDTQDQLVRTEKLAAIGHLAGGVAHDLRNPLGAIKNAIYYLNRKLADNEAFKSEPRIGQFLKIIEEEVDHSNKIISDLLDFARLGTLSSSPINLSEVIERTLSSVELREQVNVIREFDAELPQVVADAEQLQRVFTNLTLNARDAMPDGGDLTITTRMMDDFAEIAFKDTGEGISDGMLSSIFDPLFTTKTQGTGLGLAVCQQVVSKHGGTIGVVSKEGEGATFAVKIPLDLSDQG